MSLVRKVRKVGTSLIITLPRHIAEVYDIKEGVGMKITLGPNRTIVLTKEVIE